METARKQSQTADESPLARLSSPASGVHNREWAGVDFESGGSRLIRTAIGLGADPRLVNRK